MSLAPGPATTASSGSDEADAEPTPTATRRVNARAPGVDTSRAPVEKSEVPEAATSLFPLTRIWRACVRANGRAGVHASDSCASPRARSHVALHTARSTCTWQAHARAHARKHTISLARSRALVPRSHVAGASTHLLGGLHDGEREPCVDAKGQGEGDEEHQAERLPPRDRPSLPNHEAERRPELVE